VSVADRATRLRKLISQLAPADSRIEPCPSLGREELLRLCVRALSLDRCPVQLDRCPALERRETLQLWTVTSRGLLHASIGVGTCSDPHWASIDRHWASIDPGCRDPRATMAHLRAARRLARAARRVSFYGVPRRPSCDGHRSMRKSSRNSCTGQRLTPGAISSDGHR
jgi:hypothetical protein